MATYGRHLSANATVAAHGAIAVTPEDTTQLQVTRALYIGGAGNLNVTMADGQTLVFANVPVGIFPIQVQVVWDTSTLATNIVALY